MKSMTAAGELSQLSIGEYCESFRFTHLVGRTVNPRQMFVNHSLARHHVSPTDSSIMEPSSTWSSTCPYHTSSSSLAHPSLPTFSSIL